MQIVGLNDVLGQVVQVNHTGWGMVMCLEADHILRMAVDFEVEGTRKS